MFGSSRHPRHCIIPVLPAGHLQPSIQRLIRSATTVLLLLAGLTVAPAGGPATALADDAGVSAPCDDDAFDAALATAQMNGGGTITFDCGGPTTIDVDNTKAITAGNSVIIDGAGLITFDGGEDTQLFTVEAGARLVLLNLALNNGSAAQGGAVFNQGTLTVIASGLDGNRSTGIGGAVFNQGTLTVTTSSFSDNRASGGGAIYNDGMLTVTASTFNDNRAASGGALSNGGDINSTHTLTASTFSGNSADRGGAIFNSAPLAVVATTFSANSARFDGGAIQHRFRTLTVTASTFDGNSTEMGSGGAIFNFFPEPVIVQGSILANTPSSDNCGGAISSGGSNVSDDASCNFGAGSFALITLGALQDNGGPTFTMLPPADSPAVDSASCSDSSLLDQRGATRPVGSDCDKGAVERDGTVPAVQLFGFSGDDGVEGTPIQIYAAGYSEADASLAFDCQNDGSFDTAASSAGSSGAAACLFLDEEPATIRVQLCDTSIPANCVEDEIEVTILNAAPLIDAITLGPVSSGQPVDVTVAASDPGLLDVLSYSFDCDGDGSYDVVSQPTNTASCTLDPSQASTTINVLVEDGDGASAAGSVTVSQAATVCVDRYTGGLSAPSAGGACPAGMLAMSVPGPAAMTICINSYTGALTWSPQGTCGSGQRVHVVPDDGPLSYCQSLFTGKLRYSANGQCGAYERPGVIPG